MATFVTVIVVAAGSSTRMGIPKMLIPLDGTPALIRTLTALDAAAQVDELIVVAREADISAFRQLCEAHPFRKPLRFVEGGATRGESAARGLAAVDGAATHIAVHDGARPLVTSNLVDRVIQVAVASGAAAAAVPVKDTVKAADENGFVTETLPREQLWAMQTPQVFERALYETALAQAGNTTYTDDCQLVERVGHPVQLVQGDYRNLKLTTPEDVCMAEGLLKEKETTSMRIGHGYDVHRLTEGRRLILGGVEIPYEKGLLGHSDADVLVHAIMDALLGAATCGDIGGLFPDTDPHYAGADSMQLLEQVMGKVRQAGYTPANIDATVLAQAPKLKPYIPAMREGIAAVCGMPLSAVNIKATTEEGLGFTGSGEGIAAHAVCLLLSALP